MAASRLGTYEPAPRQAPITQKGNFVSLFTQEEDEALRIVERRREGHLRRFGDLATSVSRASAPETRDQRRGWLSDSTSALLALVWADVWNLVPLAVILILAALQRIPSELYDAARVDGAGPFQMFRYVTFPWLAQALLIVLILQTIAAIRAFDVIYVLTAGGPGNSTTTLTWQTFLTTFESLNFGLGNAYAWTVSIITMGLAVLYFRLLYRRGEFEA
jgi:multiple sugar transport system permease protein